MNKEINCFSCNKICDIPDDLISEYKKGNLVIFAGSGISTEQKGLMPYTLYEEIFDELGLSQEEDKYSFSELMSLFCNEAKVKNGRKKLLIKIKSRIEYIKSFVELYNNVSNFYYELSGLYMIENIVTTNWDNFFEEECRAQPYVIPEDFAFYDIDERKVFKIHGSISNLSTLVATKEDYDKCFNDLNSGILGANLKLLLSTKTIVFIGYSLEDEDFKQIYGYLQKELGEILPHSYIVKPTNRISNYYKNFSLTIIESTGISFIKSLKNQLIQSNFSLNINMIAYLCPILYSLLQKYHSEIKMFKLKENPYLLYTYAYQDGLLNTFSRYFRTKLSGDYYDSEYLESIIELYENIKKEKIEQKLYTDIAYIDGYIHGLSIILLIGKFDDNIKIDNCNFLKPYYLLFNKESYYDKSIFEKELINYNKIFMISEDFIKDAYSKSREDVLKIDSELEPHFQPFI